MRARPALLLLLLGSLLFWSFSRAPMAIEAAAKRSLIGSRVENFSLRDFHGNPQSLADFQDRKLIVIAFLGCDCPLAKVYTPRLVELSKQYEPQGVQFVGVNSNLQDTPTEIARWAQTYNVPFPVLKDAGNTLADKLLAERTPQVYVLDAVRNVRYCGRIDDQFGVGLHKQKAANRELATAIEELLADKPVTTPTTEATGCAIGRVRKTEPRGDVTYSNQIARIVNARCVECHRTGELAPFPLTTYDEVIGWADTMREVIDQGRMPPWFADPQHGKFSNDCSMTADEKKLFGQWVENGCPEGDRKQLPPAPEFAAGWRMGKPDAVYEMTEPYTVAAEGVIDYQYFQIDPKFTEDKWITVAEARPGNPAVVHHVVLFAIPPGTDVSKPEQAQADGQMIAVYAPGMPPWKYPEGSALKVRAGSTFFIQMHYTTDGREQQDRSLVGLKFADPASVKKKVMYGMAVNAGFEIPPHADNHEVVTKVKFSRDMLLLNLFPHMHYRGKSFRFDAVYPDGTTETLLDVPHYDFNWQLRYDFTEPKLLPKGTKLLCTGHFDNSENNPSNPDPTKKVRFGLQTFEEMMVGYYTILRADEDLTQKKK
ncbi:MAG TPA: redoxin domain-containing protein [Pirellulales bacterium]